MRILLYSTAIAVLLLIVTTVFSLALAKTCRTHRSGNTTVTVCSDGTECRSHRSGNNIVTVCR